MTIQLRRTALLLAALAPAAAQAHPGHDAGSTFVAGVLHPLSGIDHLLMIVAVSIWAAALTAGGRILVAAVLGTFIAVGALLPVAPSPGPALEAAIALTVIGAGMLLALGRRWPIPAGGALVAGFALVHGFAHGAEGPADSRFYVIGLVAATAGLALAVSFSIARLQPGRIWMRVAGVVTAATGAAALLG